MLASTVALIIAGSAQANHLPDCVPGQADPTTVNVIPMPLGRPHYVEERDVPSPFKTVPPTPFSGALFGNGTWIYQEANDIPGLQRGQVGCFDPWHTFCTENPLMDEICDHHVDALVWTSEFFPALG